MRSFAGLRWLSSLLLAAAPRPPGTTIVLPHQEGVSNAIGLARKDSDTLLDLYKLRLYSMKLFREVSTAPDQPPHPTDHFQKGKKMNLICSGHIGLIWRVPPTLANVLDEGSYLTGSAPVVDAIHMRYCDNLDGLMDDDWAKTVCYYG